MLQTTLLSNFNQLFLPASPILLKRCSVLRHTSREFVEGNNGSSFDILEFSFPSVPVFCESWFIFYTTRFKDDLKGKVEKVRDSASEQFLDLNQFL